MMRDPIEKVKETLRSAGAVYRGGGTKQRSDWVFPGGEIFVFERKSSNPGVDARVASRKLNQVLARRSGAPVEAKPLVNGKAIETPAAVPEAPPQPPPALVFPKLNTAPSASMKDRWTEAVAQAEAYQEKLLADATLAEKRVQMLKAMSLYAADPFFEDTLRSVLPVVVPAKSVITLPPPPPQAIEDRVQVTRDLVFAATCTFNAPFTVNDLVDRMINGRNVPKDERLRIRSSVASCVLALGERGQLEREFKGIGRQQSIWKKAQHGDLPRAGAPFVDGPVQKSAEAFDTDGAHL